MDPLTSIGLVLWTLISLGLTLNVLHPLINRDRARPLSLIFGFGLGWLIGELTIQWILLNAGIFLLLLVFADLEVLVFSWMLGIHLLLWILLLVRLWLVLNQVEYLEDQMLNQLGTE
ncbi:MAG: alpha/beta hydrolase, partial [bacterium]